MDDFLTPVSTTTVKKSATLSAPTTTTEHGSSKVTLTSPEDAVKILRGEPDFGSLIKVLQWLISSPLDNDAFNLAAPGPLQAQIIGVLVTDTIPSYWGAIKSSKNHITLLVNCLRNGSGLGAIISRLRPLIADCRQKKAPDQRRDSSVLIQDLIDILQYTLKDDDVSCQIWRDAQSFAQHGVQQRLIWKEYVGLIASGKVLAIVAEAEDVLKERDSLKDWSWLANGAQYASWLGRNLVALMKRNIDIEGSALAVTEMCGMVPSLGHFDKVVAAILSSIVVEGSSRVLEIFLPKLKIHEQRKYLNAIITYLAKECFGSDMTVRDDTPLKASATISASLSLFKALLRDNEFLQSHLVTSLVQSSIPALDDSLSARRAIIAATAQSEEKLHDLLEKSLKLFGDSFYIAHSPTLQQEEALAQNLAMTSGYVQRSQPMFLTMMAKSSYHVSGMSNRIAASSPRARFLGMAVGIAISKLVDKADLQLKFELDGAEADEAKWYQRLTEVDDKVGKLAGLRKHTASSSTGHVNRVKTNTGFVQTNTGSTKPAITEITGSRIVEILDAASDDDDDDLVAYEKPDSDPEDDTDDPTEINRNKPVAPVYIRDLIAGLRDQENYDRHQLALETAASLIKRKSNFGSEVTDHIEELASVLVGLNNNLDLPGFSEQRQQALIATLLAKPPLMAQWFARTFFSGDFSVIQRMAMLTTLGIGARELAGLKDPSTESLVPSKPDFPSKRLPSHLHRMYAETSNPVARITSNLTKEFLSPLAANAAEQLSGPNILKVRTFSSRMEVEKKRSKPIPNALAQIVADHFFFPLTGRWWITARSSGSDSVYTSTHLLPPFLHTLALLLNASGANTLALPQMTREFWELLLSVRGLATSNKAILGALLFAFLMLLETNENKERLATEQARELMETQEWVRVIFDGLGAGSEEDEKIRALAAGVIVRCQEVVDKYQRRMAGTMMDY